ncbi:MAG TPA: SMP-30/gluconolactonase/LRE family protein [Chitinophagaceae bacterium]|jgi:DNA-binding beta-propeller fold protein YncE|nr:SMP-30/gluconolactonase/LRE family protein [Chitinophagaceae bacterium]
MKKYLLVAGSLVSFAFAFAQNNQKVISTKTEKDVIPEGITIDPVKGTIYVSSIAHKKIIAIDPNGTHEDFITTNKDGFLEGLGMKIDAKKHWLWAVSNEKQDNWFVSKVHAFDLATGAAMQQYVLRDTARHLWNDLILHPNGKVYITDTYGSSIYEVDPGKQKLKIFLRDSLIAWPNGICFNTKGKIYIATYSHGLIQLDPSSKKLSLLTGYADSVKAYNLDGLVYWNNTIIGVYNSAAENKDNAIVQYFLNDAGDKIISEKIIDKGNDLFHEPTTAALMANKLYVLANSYLTAYNVNHESVKGIEDKLGPVSVIVYELK